MHGHKQLLDTRLTLPLSAATRGAGSEAELRRSKTHRAEHVCPPGTMLPTLGHAARDGASSSLGLAGHGSELCRGQRPPQGSGTCVVITGGCRRLQGPRLNSTIESRSKKQLLGEEPLALGELLPRGNAAGREGEGSLHEASDSERAAPPWQGGSTLALQQQTEQMLRKLLPSTSRLHLVTAGGDAHGKEVML